MKYEVYVAEVHYQVIQIEDAIDEADAVAQANDRIAEEDSLHLEYSHTLDTREWKTKEIS